jgi:RHS repeat-associated protein
MAYDAEGNLTSKTNTATSAVTRYHWNTDHELTSVDLPDGSTVRYSYDPLRRRIQTVEGSKVTRYAWDAFNLAAIYDGSNHLVTSYVTLPTGADAADVKAPAEVLERTDAQGTAYFMHDGLGSTTGLTDAVGTVTSRYRYNTAGLAADGNGHEVGYTWTGAQYDAGTGLYYLNDRYYDPATGRFISEDPASAQFYDQPLGRWTHSTSTSADTSSVGSNRYAYSGDDPVNSRDPSGDMKTKIGVLECLIPAVIQAAIATPDKNPLWVLAVCSNDIFEALDTLGEAAELIELIYKGDYQEATMKGFAILIQMLGQDLSEELLKGAFIDFHDG